MRAFEKDSGEEVFPGDYVTDFRGESAILAELVRAEEPGRDGKVQVEGSPVAYYAGVFNLRVRDDKDVESDTCEAFQQDGSCIHSEHTK